MTATPASARPTFVRLAIGLAVLVVLVMVGREFAGALPRFVNWVDGLGAWGPVVFIGGYAVATVAFVPGALMTLGAGAVFGLLEGVLYVLVGATVGSSLAFLISRHLARRAIEPRLAGNRHLSAIDRAVGESGFRIVLLLRLSPVVPFNLLNYGLGLTKVRFRDYLLASIGMLPGSLLYTYYGKVAGDVAMLAADPGVRRGTGYYVLLGVGLAATVLVATVIARQARRALRARTGE